MNYEQLNILHIHVQCILYNFTCIVCTCIQVHVHIHVYRCIFMYVIMTLQEAKKTKIKRKDDQSDRGGVPCTPLPSPLEWPVSLLTHTHTRL